MISQLRFFGKSLLKLTRDGNDGIEVVEKLRMMGFSNKPMPVPAVFTCKECNTEIVMDTFEYECPHCGMVYAVTPCHAFDVANILSAGKLNK